jgi:hypothetical protein
MASSEPIAELGGRTWGELELKRHPNGRLMFPDALRRRTETGAIEDTKIRVCVPGPEEEIEARVKCRAIFVQRKLDPKEDKDLFAEVEQVCLLSLVIRTPDEPHPQAFAPEELLRYDEASLKDVLERINAYRAALEVRDTVIDEDKFWAVVREVGRTSSVLPLTGIAGHVQPSFVVRMAREALHSPKAKSSAPSSETSTPAPSH